MINHLPQISLFSALFSLKYSVFNVNRLLECYLNMVKILNLTATVLLGNKNMHLLVPAQSYYKI